MLFRANEHVRHCGEQITGRTSFTMSVDGIEFALNYNSGTTYCHSEARYGLGVDFSGTPLSLFPEHTQLHQAPPPSMCITSQMHCTPRNESCGNRLPLEEEINVIMYRGEGKLSPGWTGRLGPWAPASYRASFWKCCAI